MNGFPGPPVSPWQEHHTPDGRAYYYNAATKVTQWTKPEEMMNPAERALANQPWKEYTAEGGRKYWYNAETKQSSWEMPEAFKNAIGISEPRAPPTGPMAHSQGSRPSYRDQGRGGRDQRDAISDSRHPSRTFVPATDSAPEYATKEEAVAAFVKVLRRFGVQPDWSWKQVVRTVAKDPQFRAIKSPRSRKEAFAKYCEDMIVQEQERAQERFAKLRSDFETMFKRNPEITHITRWKTARPMLEGETHFRSTDNEDERRQLFRHYVTGLKKQHREQQIAQRKAALDGLKDLLPKLDITAYTRWHDGRQIIATATQNDAKYHFLTKSDILIKFQDHIRSLERTLNERRQRNKKMEYRRERQNRDAFKDLLFELRRAGHIKANSKWADICLLIRNDDRYLNMLGQNGSSPMSLLWDMVEDEERALRGPRNDVIDVLKDKRFELTATTTLDEFMSLMRDDRRTHQLDQATLQLIFERLREKRVSKREDERQVGRQHRHASDNLRSYMKRLDPPIVVGDTYEIVRSRISQSSEYQAMGSDDAARHIYDRHMRRLRERANEEPDRGNRRSSLVSSDRDISRRNHDRSRGERSHREGRPSRRSRSPEHDSYEADRRRAVAERERNHRKSVLAESVLAPGDRGRLSPPPRRDRDREYDRFARPRRSEEGSYTRERREREDERERPLRRPTDTRSVDELNYGDERPSSASRRRRPDDDEPLTRKDARDPKRIKREPSRERTPRREGRPRNKSPPSASKEARAVRSGSEEGEIEE